MDRFAFAGALLRLLRLERNWSQETLCQGICAVSYLSKIEQGRVEANDTILTDLFAKLGFDWTAQSHGNMEQICAEAYEAVFSGNPRVSKDCKAAVTEKWNKESIGPWYLDLAVLHAYCTNDPEAVPEQMIAFLSPRQACLFWLLKRQPQTALRHYPCALTLFAAGEECYRQGNYLEALELLQRCFDMSCLGGYVYLMLNCRAYMANCYSDMQDLDKMMEHSCAAQRMAEALGDKNLVDTLRYNIAATRMECGDFEQAYGYFASKESCDAMHLHKLAICCEKLGKREEAIASLDRVNTEDLLDQQMCDLVAFRLQDADYLHREEYGALLMKIFRELRQNRAAGYARFHLPWIEEWCVANRQYRTVYEIMKDFTK